jgi:hypothetical protein
MSESLHVCVTSPRGLGSNIHPLHDILVVEKSKYDDRHHDAAAASDVDTMHLLLCCRGQEGERTIGRLW